MNKPENERHMEKIYYRVYFIHKFLHCINGMGDLEESFWHLGALGKVTLYHPSYLSLLWTVLIEFYCMQQIVN